MKKLAMLLALSALVLPSLTPVRAADIRITGQETLAPLARKWAERYMAANAETKIRVTGRPSSAGIAALQNKSADLWCVSRKIKAQEIADCVEAFGQRPTEYKVALDSICVYVNADNPLTEISREDIKQVFTGKVRNWKELGSYDAPITLYTREGASSSYEFFKEEALGGKDFAPGAQTIPSAAGLSRAVARDKTGIGFGGMAVSGAKTLRVKENANSVAVAPTDENIAKGVYPLRRYLYLYVNPAAEKGEVATFLQWLQSDEAQQIAQAAGFFPLPKNLRG